MAVELDLCHSLLQWPYLTDMSLINAMVAIFQPTWCTGPRPFMDTLQLKLNPWLYVNVVVRQSQVCVRARLCVCVCMCVRVCTGSCPTMVPYNTHARTHARTHAKTHTHTCAHTDVFAHHIAPP
jgi:hypothetical protein